MQLLFEFCGGVVKGWAGGNSEFRIQKRVGGRIQYPESSIGWVGGQVLAN